MSTGHSEARVTLRQRRLAAQNEKWKVYFDHIADAGGHEVEDYLVVVPRTMPRELVTGVTVLPVRADGRVVLLDMWRHAVARRGWEAVRGFVDAGEAPEQAAMRELAEEAGLACAPGDLVPLGFCAPESTTIAGRAALFAATCCRPGGTRDPSEVGLGQARDFSLDEIEDMERRFVLEDATTLVALHRYLRWRRGGQAGKTAMVDLTSDR